MKKQLSDEQFEKLMQTLIKDASPDDAAIDEIADSPTLWWSVQREIVRQKATRSPWPPALRRWMIAGVPVLAALALVSFFVFRQSIGNTEQAGSQRNVTTTMAESPRAIVAEPAVPADDDKEAVVKAVRAVPGKYKPSAVKGTIAIARYKPATNDREVAAKNEIRSDFIALSYARNPESGQIVRVKVPSSMMVTLGLVSSVEKPANLVDAEVVVGDDGLTHAIRFIR